MSAQTFRNQLREAGLASSTSTFTCSMVHECPGVELGETDSECGSATSRISFYSDVIDDNVCSYIRRNYRFANNCVAQVNRFGGGSVMMWEVISYTDRSELVFVLGNIQTVYYSHEMLRCPGLGLDMGSFQ